MKAFSSAQLDGDWSHLEAEMAAVLGPEAVGVNEINSNEVEVSTNSISTSTTTAAPSGLGYYMAVANNYVDRFAKVFYEPDPSDFLSEDEKVKFISCYSI